MAAKKGNHKNTSAHGRRKMSRATRIRKRIFGITSLILAIVVANIPMGASAVATESQLGLDASSATPVQWTLNLTASDISHVSLTGSKLNVRIEDSSYTSTEIENNILNPINTALGGKLNGKEDIEGEYTNAKVFDVSYWDYDWATSILSSAWNADTDWVVLKLSDLDKLVPAFSGGVLETEDWNAYEAAQFGSQPLVMAYNTGTNAWELADGVYKPAIGTNKKYEPLDGIRINGKTTMLAIVYRMQIRVNDFRSVTIKEPHASVVNPKTNGTSEIIELNSTTRANDYNNSIRKLAEVEEGGPIDDEDYYELHMEVDGKIQHPDSANARTYAVSIPLPDNMNWEKGKMNVYLLRHNRDAAASGRYLQKLTETDDNLRFVTTAYGNTAIQFHTNWFDDLAVVFTPSVPRYDVTVNHDISDPYDSANPGNAVIDPSVPLSDPYNPSEYKGSPYIVDDATGDVKTKKVFAGGSAQFEANQTPGYKVWYWNVNGVKYDPAGSRERFTLSNISENKSVVVFYENDKNTRTVTINNTDGGGNPSFGDGTTVREFTVKGGGPYDNSGIEIQAFPNAGKELAYWMVNDERVDVGASKSVYGVDVIAPDKTKIVLNNLADDTIVIAYYQDTVTPPPTYDITLAVEGKGTATVTDGINTTSTTGASVILPAAEGATFTATQIEDTGSKFLRWEVTPEGEATVNDYSVTYAAPLNKNITIKAVFGDATSAKTIQIIPTAGGQVSFDNVNFSASGISRNVPAGTAVPVYSKSNAGHSFNGWSITLPLSGGGSAVSTSPSYNPTVDEDVTYYANYIHVGHNRIIQDTRSEQLLSYQLPSVSPNSDLPGSGDEILLVSDNLIGDIDTALFDQGLFTGNSRSSVFNLQLYYTTDGTTPGGVVNDYNYNPLQVISLELPKFMNERSQPKLYYLDTTNKAIQVVGATITTNSDGARVVTFTPPAMTDYAFLQTIDATEAIMEVASDVSNGTVAVTPQKPDPLPGDRTLTVKESETAKNNATAKLGTTVAYNQATAFTVRMTNSQTKAQADDVGNVTIKLPLPASFDPDLGTILAYHLDNNGNASPVSISPTIAKESGITYATIPNTKEYNDDYLFLFRERYTYASPDQRTRYRSAQDASAAVTSPTPIEEVVQGHRRIVFRDSSGSTILPLLNNDDRYKKYAHKDPFDISYTDENFNVMPSSEFNTATVSLTIEDKAMPNLKLVTVGTDGKPEEISFSKNGNVLAFTTTHFTDFALLYDEPAGKVRIYVETDGDGSVFDDNNQAVTDYVEVDANSSVNLWARATDPANTRFVGWKDTTTNQPTGNPSTQARQAFDVGTENRWLTAVFENNAPGGPYAVSAIVSPNGSGTVTGMNSNVPAGTNITLTAEPASGYQLSRWIDNLAPQTASGNTYTISNIDRNHDVIVEFVPTGGGGGGSTPGNNGQTPTNNPPSGVGTQDLNIRITAPDGTVVSGTGATAVYVHTGKPGTNSIDMPRTGMDQAMVYKMLAVVILVMFGVIELLGSVNTKKRRVVTSG
ncbi:MAG: hypothetical protein IJQ21_04530 [Lachnospiraceae bacterium]|nr:hypothetical protein [Lachnospiraceae bacterium]